MRNGSKTVGILAVQGDFALHAKMLDRFGAPWRLVKRASDLNGASGLIMPGGESTTMLKFMEGEGLGPAILNFARLGKPIFGTCAGSILLAKQVLSPAQAHLGLIDITIERNAYGRQIDSAVRLVTLRGLSPAAVPPGGSAGSNGDAGRTVGMVFIRAPIIRRVGEGVRVLGTSEGVPVLVEQGNILAATFHPELTEDEAIHRYFVSRLQPVDSRGNTG